MPANCERVNSKQRELLLLLQQVINVVHKKVFMPVGDHRCLLPLHTLYYYLHCANTTTSTNRRWETQHENAERND